MKFIYKLGNLEYNICPTKESADKLASILKQHDGKGRYEIIWGPDLSVEIVPDTLEEVVALTEYYKAKNGK